MSQPAGQSARPSYDLAGKKVWVAGHRGMAGSALVRRLASEDCRVLTVDRADCDLRRQDQVEAWLVAHRPQAVILAAGTVGGIVANMTRPVDFLYDNLAIANAVIPAAHAVGVEKLLYLGSSCIYPRAARQPMEEAQLMTGPLEPTNEWYALAKIAGIKLCQAYRRQHGCDFIAAIPTNLFGPGDTFDVETGHVVAGLIVKAHAARSKGDARMELWGTGTALREFLYVDDLADALVLLLRYYSDEAPVNVGSGIERSILELAQAVAEAVGYQGGFNFDAGKPDGMPRKLIDSSRLHAWGWRPSTPLSVGLRAAYEDYRRQLAADTTGP